MGWGLALAHGVKLPPVVWPQACYCHECDISEVVGEHARCWLCGGPMRLNHPKYWPYLAGEQHVVGGTSPTLLPPASSAR